MKRRRILRKCRVTLQVSRDLHGAGKKGSVHSHPLAQCLLHFSWYIALVESDVIICNIGRHHASQATTAVHKHRVRCLLRAATDERECDQGTEVLDTLSALSHTGNTFNHSHTQ